MKYNVVCTGWKKSAKDEHDFLERRGFFQVVHGNWFYICRVSPVKFAKEPTSYWWTVRKDGKFIAKGKTQTLSGAKKIALQTAITLAEGDKL